MLRRPLVLLVLILAACSPQDRPLAASGADTPPKRDDWWASATRRASGAERILAPRELRALLVTGEGYGFDADAAWWNERLGFVFERILELDTDDEQANAGKGYRTLQSYPGFGALWERMLVARVTGDDIDGLISQYDHKVFAEESVFLDKDGYTVESARLARVRAHLNRLAADPAYEALQVALARVRGSSLSDFPFVHHQAGPFLVFYCARDLQRIEGEDDALESRRIAEREVVYQQRLKALGSLYIDLVKDIETLYPELWKLHAPKPREIHYQWIFADRDWYGDFVERVRKTNPESTYRSGFLDRATGWAYLFEPTEIKVKDDQPPPISVDARLRETAAYLAARQLMHHWGKDPVGVGNRMSRSRAYWLKEGWPSFLASRRMKRPEVGRRLIDAKQARMIFPPLGDVVERESRLELRLWREPAQEFFEDDEPVRLPVKAAFTDLSWLLVRYCNGDKRRAAFERYMLSQVAGENSKLSWFEKSFGISGESGWARMQRDVYRSLEAR